MAHQLKVKVFKGNFGGDLLQDNINEWLAENTKDGKCVILNRIKRGKFCCPVCGDYRMNIYDHHVGYPEIWVEWSCKNCGQWVGGADNSLPAHITESMREVRSMKDIRRMLDILV